MSETKTRKTLTLQERIERDAAKLAELKAKADEKASKRATELREQRAKLVTKRDEIDGKIKDIDTELVGLEADDAPVAEADVELPIEDDEV